MCGAHVSPGHEGDETDELLTGVVMQEGSRGEAGGSSEASSGSTTQRDALTGSVQGLAGLLQWPDGRAAASRSLPRPWTADAWYNLKSELQKCFITAKKGLLVRSMNHRLCKLFGFLQCRSSPFDWPLLALIMQGSLPPLSLSRSLPLCIHLSTPNVTYCSSSRQVIMDYFPNNIC